MNKLKVTFIMNNEELEEMEFSMNNEEMEEMDSNPCFPETITDSLLQTTLEETTTHVGESSVATRSSKELTNEQRLTIFHFLLKERNKGRLQKGSVSNLSMALRESACSLISSAFRKFCFSLTCSIDIFCASSSASFDSSTSKTYFAILFASSYDPG
ncbi:hypothetical protein MKX01_040655 [Papaver californicum]|nr:hypothetical protein MKX01_040655 [Papaver californicum]